MKCEGGCIYHGSTVYKVIVYWSTPKGLIRDKFNYCIEAIEEDRRRGLLVKPVYKISGLLDDRIFRK